ARSIRFWTLASVASGEPAELVAKKVLRPRAVRSFAAGDFADVDRRLARRLDSSGRQWQGQEQLQWVIQHRLEPVLTVKVGRGFVLGMHEQEFQTGDFGSLDCAQDRILEECLAEALGLFTMMHRQARQQNDRNCLLV